MGAKQGSMPMVILVQSQSLGLLVRSSRNSFSLRFEYDAQGGQLEGHSHTDAILLYQGVTVVGFSCEDQLFAVHESAPTMQHLEQPGSSGALHPANASDKISIAVSSEKHCVLQPSKKSVISPQMMDAFNYSLSLYDYLIVTVNCELICDHFTQYQFIN
jgi:hypothetical protein